MRPDMAKVVTESPRRGSGKPNRKSRQRVLVQKYDPEGQEDYDGPARYSMAHHGRGYDYKEFSDNLGPLKKWLKKQVGRRWDDVYSEARRVFPNRAPEPVRHVWEDHLSSWVERTTRMGTNGRVYYCSGTSFGGNMDWRPVGRNYSSWMPFYYVHPVTGVLMEAPPFLPPPKAPWPFKYRDAVVVRNVWNPVLRTHTSACRDRVKDYTWPEKYGVLLVDEDTRAVRREGIWYLGTWNGNSFKIRQMSRKELRGYGLRNSHVLRR